MNVDEILGNRNTRYFGVGYKNANYEIVDLNLASSEALVKVSFGNEIWSIKQGIARPPHLSTLDSIIVASMVVEQILGVAESSNYYVSHFDIRAGSVPIELRDSLKVKFSQNDNNYHFNILGMKINLVIKPTTKLNYPMAGSESFLTQHLKNSKLTIEDIKSIGQTTLGGVALKKVTAIDYLGLGSITNRSFFIYEWLIIFSQIGEMLTYQLDNLHRNDCANLWMRRISADYHEQSNPRQATSVMGEVIKSRVIEKDGHRWRTLTAHGSDINNQVYFSAQMAHELPQGRGGDSNE